MSKFIRDNQLNEYIKDEEVIHFNKQKKIKRFKDLEEQNKKQNKKKLK